MTTPSVTESDQDWQATADEILAAIAARPERWRTIGRYRGRTFSYYQVSDKGALRSVDRVLSGRRYRGTTLKTRFTDEYERGNIRDDSGDVLTEYVHRLVLAKFRPGGIPPGMETRHGPAGPGVNAYPENLTVGDGVQNAADKPEPSAPPDPAQPCRNAPACGNKVVNAGSRCLPCVTEVGRRAAALLGAGMNLADVAAVFGYKSADWTHGLAVRHGGYQGTRADAMAQRPPIAQRAVLRFRFRRLLRQSAADRQSRSVTSAATPDGGHPA